MSEQYSITAKYYDAEYDSKKELVDVPFYVDMAKRFSGPVLEIACGTGRVLLPTARAGFEIHGIDYSAPMLGMLRNQLKSETKDVQNRVTLHEGDMRSFLISKKFRLVTIPFRPMQHMYTVEDQVAALRTAASHLDVIVDL